MKIITFWGGLGNQIFEYAYMKWLQSKYPREKFYGFYPKIGLSAHNGLEINQRFKVELPPETFLTNFIGYFLFHSNRLFRRLKWPLFFTCTQQNQHYKSCFHCDYWQDKKYILPNFNLQFCLENLGEKNKTILDMMERNDIVAVHIRRGDYIYEKNIKLYGGICTDEYYMKAISYIKSKIDNPFFVFFSDDTEYVRERFSYLQMLVVDWNKGENSYYDMFLMSQSKNMILANSTFSYWAARLNTKHGIICCPSKWKNYNEPDIILDNWKIIVI